MREVVNDIQRWREHGRAAALVTVIATWGSAPRPTGSKMAISDQGEMAGSVSGGCVEAATVEEALDVLRSGRPKRVHFGVSDDTAWDVGLACGGEIDLFVEPLAPLFEASPGGSSGQFERLAGALAENQPIVRAVVVDGGSDLVGRSWLLDSEGHGHGSLPAWLIEAVEAPARSLLSRATPRLLEVTAAEAPVTLFLDIQAPPPRLVIVGGVHLSLALASLAKTAGFHVTLVDPRRAFANRQRFPMVDQVVNRWPDEALLSLGLTHACAVAVLSHDPKLDDPALRVALPSPAFYVGALGSKRTQELRRERLRQGGMSEADIARIHGPIGLDLGGREPEEIALGILAEIVASRRGP